MNIFELSGKIMLDDNDAKKKIDGIDSSGKKADKTLGGMVKTAGKWGAALGAAAIAASAAIGGAVIKYGNFADQLLDLSAITGMSTDEMQRWRQVAVDAGVDTDTMANAMQTLNKQLERGNEVSPRLAKAFETMNMTADEFKKVNPDEQMRLLVGTMMDLEEADRRAFANQMNMADMLPMIAELEAEGKSLDEVMEGIDVPFSEDDLNQMNNVRKAWDNIKQAAFETIGQALMPVFDWVNNNMPLIESVIETTVEKVGEFIGWWIGFVDNLIDKFTNWKEDNQETLDTIRDAFTTFTETAIAIITTAIDNILAFWDEWGEDIVDTTVEYFDMIRGVIQTILNAIEAFWDEWGDDIMAFLSTTFTTIYSIVKTSIELMQAIIETVLGIIERFWGTWGDTIMGFVSIAFNTIKTTIETVLGLIQGVLDVFVGIFTGDWERLWEGLEGIVKSAANGIIGLVNGIIGAVESMVGALGKGVNAIPSFEIPSWVPGLGGKSFGIPDIPSPSFPRIPSLDTGTNKVLSDGLAMIHKGETIIPAKHSGKYREDSGNIDLRIDLDGRQIMRALRVPMTKEIRLATGMKL